MNTIEQALEIAHNRCWTGTYWLGTGDCDTPKGGKSDCFGFAFNTCYNIRRHRPGFNQGSWASVSDDLNCNSAIEDAQHKQELFTEVPAIELVKPGDLIAYPSFSVWDSNHNEHKYIGHIAIVTSVYTASTYDKPQTYHNLNVIQCCGPNGREPGIIASDGTHWDLHDHVWPGASQRTHILRPVQGAA